MTKDENNALGKVETRVAGLEITTKELHREVINLKEGQETILTNCLPTIEKKVSDLKWWYVASVALIAILVGLFGSLIILGN